MESPAPTSNPAVTRGSRTSMITESMVNDHSRANGNTRDKMILITIRGLISRLPIDKPAMPTTPTMAANSICLWPTLLSKPGPPPFRCLSASIPHTFHHQGLVGAAEYFCNLFI